MADTINTNRINTNRRMLPPRAGLAAAVALALLAAPPTARAGIEDTYSPGEPPVSTTWFGAASADAMRTDREYVAGMRPHHVGALSMSRDYLADPARSSPLLQALARAIIANQAFEIGMLDEVERNLDRPPVRFGFGMALQPQATEGLAGTQRFFKEPVPGPLAHPLGPVSENDVRFAKAMILHHQAAVEMARGYHAERDGRNGYLGLMNVDIITDQTQEIALMRRAIAAYPGDADTVRVDPSMVHGMEGMKHGAGAVAPQAGTGHAAHHGSGHHGAAHASRAGSHAMHHGGGHAAHHGRQGAAHGQYGGHHGEAGAAQGAAVQGEAQPRSPSAQRSRSMARRPHAPASEHGHHHDH